MRESCIISLKKDLMEALLWAPMWKAAQSSFLNFFINSSFTAATYSNNISGLVVTFAQEGLPGDGANLQAFCFGQFQGCNNDAVSVGLTLQASSDGSAKLRSASYFWPDWSIKAWQMWAGSMLTLMTVVELHLQDGQQLIQSPDMISHWPQQLESCHPQHTVSPWNEHCWLCLSRDWFIFLFWTER